MPSLPESDWQIRSNGQEYGPYSRARILEMLVRRELPETAAIRGQGMADWLPVPDARRLLADQQAAAGAVRAAGAVVAAPAAEEASALDAVHDGDGAAIAAPVAASPSEAPVPEEAPPPAKRRRSRAPWIYALVALAALGGVFWLAGGGDPAGERGYLKMKAELTARMDYWRDHQVRLQAVPADAVAGELVGYSVDPPAAPVGEGESRYTYVIHCRFRDGRGKETESKVTVTMESHRLRLWNLFSK